MVTDVVDPPVVNDVDSFWYAPAVFGVHVLVSVVPLPVTPMKV
jgi:hypothetical protein